MGEELRNRIDIDSNRCPYCRDVLASDDSKVGCEKCMAWQHRECAETHGACVSCGHDLVGGVAPESDEIKNVSPTFFWVTVFVVIAAFAGWGYYLHMMSNAKPF